MRPEANRSGAMFWLERYLWAGGVRHVAGVDEAGRGPLAGPVVAAAVIFPEEVSLPEVNDSKLLAPELRESLFDRIRALALSVGVGEASVEEIDRLNILQATFLAMRRALAGLSVAPEYLVLDGPLVLPDTTMPQTALIKGDRRCFSIAAASIIAKVHRDHLMQEYGRIYPQYHFERNKGYCTKAHVDAIRLYGRCALHRRSFTIREICDDLFDESGGE
ncbi:MAG: ribonuclease HII [Candidatus Zixiibacteriota bacterium]|nr:MAG: ribonuclease HII [candidate division Zixibacteria bacterium]